jgi:hypothetical protein
LNDDHFQDAETITSAYEDPSPTDQQILRDNGYYRVLNLTQDVFNDAITSYHHNSIGGYHPAKLSIIEDVLNYQLRNKQPMNIQVLNMLNAKYIIAPGQQNQPVVQQNPQALGNCWFVKAVAFVKGPAEAMKALDSFNPKDTAVIEDSFKQDIPFSVQPDSTATIKFIKNDNDLITYASNSKANQLAMFSEIFYDRGWKAYVDDKEYPIIKADYALRALALPPGSHNIRFEFRPASYYNSAAIANIASIIAWLAVIGAIIAGVRKKGSQANSNLKAEAAK